MLKDLLGWLGFSSDTGDGHAHDHHHGHGHPHGGRGHTHGVVDPTMATTERGIWAIKWSFVVLAITAALQFVVVIASGSVALLADTIHNVGDAATAIPLWIAFLFARRKPSARFTYGYGRVEDLAGVAIVLIILFSAIVAGYEAIDRLIHPQPITFLHWVAIAGIIGFLGNEAVAVFRIRVGREINSAALIADGYHARTDGLTSLAVVLGALGVWLGFPLADPIVGLLITLAIFGIVWQSSKAVFTRLLDGVEPSVIAEIQHAAAHVSGLHRVLQSRARWSGHRLIVEADIAIDGSVRLVEADAIASAFERELREHLPALQAAHIRTRPSDGAKAEGADHAHSSHGHHHGAPEAVSLRGGLARRHARNRRHAGWRAHPVYDAQAAGTEPPSDRGDLPGWPRHREAASEASCRHQQLPQRRRARRAAHIRSRARVEPRL
jgi:cation diffusion facilitator family transporter